jgi:DNA polymerase I
VSGWDTFAATWVIDFEFHAPSGHRPTPICLVAHEVRSGTTQRLWGDALADPPGFGGPSDLVVAYFATAEIGCYLALGWPRPAHLLDLYTEFRGLTNTGEPRGRSVLDACAAFGISTITAAEKDAGRALAIRGGSFTPEERETLLEYCASDVIAETALFTRMRPAIDLPHALLRGRAMAAMAACEHVGVPIDVPRLRQLQAHWDDVKAALIAEVDRDYQVFEGLTFKHDRFDRYLAQADIGWPRLASGALDLADDTFKDQARAHPRLTPLRELRSSLSQLRLQELAVGPDGRNRVLLSPFGSKTGRNTPSSARFIFGPSTWLRSLIRPEPGWGLAYLDWSHQELGIAAALSRDPALQHAYTFGDPYMDFAIRAGAAPATATKATHGAVRDLYKIVVLAVGYGIGADSLALRIGRPPVYAERLLRQHRAAYPQFWKWATAAQSYATATGMIASVFGWRLQVTPDTSPRTTMNFPAQANGAEILRLALIRLTEAGIHVCAPVHDACLIEAPLDELADTVRLAQRLMAEASAIVLDGFPLRTDATLIRYPDRYDDPRGRTMVDTLEQLLPSVPVRVAVT